MLDPNSSRHLYPYINCTACGPRYSIVTALPYDRARTTMAAWPLCPACQAEYDDPADRRHHAQPTACNQCGPTFRLVVERQTAATGVGAIQQAAERLGAGEIVAIKGIGGYHVACDARNVDAVERLRTRKFRKEKPFAVLARDLEQASALVELSDLDQALLQSIARPIVLAPARQRLPGVADGTDQLGVMLPYAPVQELLLHFDAPTPLVLTSGNRSNEPIAITDEDAEERLQEIVDAFLIGERPIQRRVDDSVVTVESGSTTVIRRARGYAPAVVAEWADRGRPLLALGADLKNTITLVVEGHAFMSPHIGDLGDLETNRAFEQAVHDFLKMYHVEPHELDVVHDAHPDYVSTQFAKNLACHQRMAIQHHRAHVAAVLAEHRQLDQEVLGFALDGTGYGDDGTIWGFEVFRGSVRAGFERIAHPRPIRLPGGDAAARFPDQAAAGYLAGLEDELTEGLSLSQRFRTALPLARRGIRCHRTTSAGRLFDAATAVCGFAGENTYEGQAAIWLEQLAMAGADTSIEYDFSELDPEGLLRPMVV
ncbi:MAG: carbamoyltransferase HypF, partial [Planctomycetota bacterium]